MDGPVVFARWRQCATRSETCLPGPTRVHIPNGTTIGSATFSRPRDCDRPTDRQTDRRTDRRTDHPTRSVTTGRIYVVLRCGLLCGLLITVTVITSSTQHHSFNGRFPGEPGSASSSSTCSLSESLGTSDTGFYGPDILSVDQPKVSKHLRKLKALIPASGLSLHPFLIYHWTSEGRDVAVLTPALQTQYHEQ